MPDNQAEYQVFVNWSGFGESILGNFETDFSIWEPEGSAIFELSDERAYSHSSSLKISQPSPVEEVVGSRVVYSLVPGRQYTVHCWAYIPPNGFHVKLTSDSFITEATTDTFGSWIRLETSFVAVATTHNIYFELVDGPGTTGTQPVFVDRVSLSELGEDITCLIFGNRASIDTNQGRETARALSSIGTSECNFEFINQDRLYSPNNPAAPFYRRGAIDARIQIRAIFEGKTRIIYNGTLDKFVINHELPDFSTISVGAIDVLGRLAATTISTELFSNLRTGEAIGKVLDAVFWPEDRRILDFGATVLDWWWAENKNALDAINEIISVEGIPALLYTDENGNVVFKDRHHRFVDEDSIHPVAGFACADGTASTL